MLRVRQYTSFNEHCTAFCRAMLCISAVYAVMRCLSVCVCVSVTFVDRVKTNKHIFNFFTIGQPHHSSFSILNGMAIYSDRNPPPNGGVECRWGRQKSAFSANIWLHRKFFKKSIANQNRYYIKPTSCITL